MNTIIPPQRDLLSAAKIVFPVLFAGANGEVNKYINFFSNERNGENKEASFALLLALIGSGKATVIDATSTMRKYGKQDALRLGEAFAESVTEDKDALAFMEAVKTDYPALLGTVIKTRKWDAGTIRKHLEPFVYTKELWFALADMVTANELPLGTPGKQ
ncbi:hypothetical protein IT401_01515 [Candidatus Nomurabacteria bacterium]|nr:hypothetical protein [Candidatus Nomurabacteria bacterium]